MPITGVAESEAEENDESILADWRNHEYTRKMATVARKNADLAIRALLNVCRSSVDPNVLRAYYAYEQHAYVAGLGGK